uniref:Uncharacterized protein n=2 Tax=Sus scrofa TaxID=9823 RepID=A0A8D0UVX3_PIG
MVSFAMQKLFRLIRYHLFIFAFISITLGDGPKKIFCNLCQRAFCLFSSESFVVSGVTFGSLIHFEFIFVDGVIECSHFIVLHVAVQFSQHHLLKRPSFSIAYSCLLCLGLIDHSQVALFLRLNIFFIIPQPQIVGYST